MPPLYLYKIKENELLQENEALKEEDEALKEENKALKEENEALIATLKKLQENKQN